MNERLIHLRIKIKSLMAEAMIIREEAKRTHGMVKWGLNHHRTTTVREHTRWNLLAYGCLRGRAYHEIEKTCDIPPRFDKVLENAVRIWRSKRAGRNILGVFRQINLKLHQKMALRILLSYHLVLVLLNI